MKTSLTFTLATLLLLTVSFLTGCTKSTPEEPCEGKGTLNIENKLDSAISVKIVQTNKTLSVEKDYTLPFSLTGDQPYTFQIEGPQYYKDTTMMILTCDNKILVIAK
jgi:hypothetical protein